jgi:hypothetical protein
VPQAPPFRSFVFATSLAWLVLCLPRSTLAQSAPRTFSLNWVRAEGAEQCASSQLLARAIEQLLGPVLSTPSEAEVAIEGVVTQPKPGQFLVQARVMTPQGDVIGARSLERTASACSALTPAILLVLTLTLDPEAAAHGFPTELLARLSSTEDPGAALLAELEAETKSAPVVSPVPVAARGTAAVGIHGPSPAPAKKPRKASGWGGALQLAAAGVVALLPRVSGGPSVAAELVTPWRFSLSLAAQYWVPAAVSFDSFGETKDVSFSALQGQLALCVPFSLAASWQLAGCVGGALGTRWVDASSLAAQGDDSRAYGGPLAQGSVRYALSERWFAALDLSGALLFRRDRFTYTDVAGESQLLFEPGAGAAWFSLGAGVKL